MPSKPEYYSDQMHMKLVIDRGTIWYDFPYTDEEEETSETKEDAYDRCEV